MNYSQYGSVGRILLLCYFYCQAEWFFDETEIANHIKDLVI